MHELAITMNILELAEREARKHKAQRINKIKLKIGEFTGVVREALEFAFEVARQGTMAEQATLDIEIVPLRKKCPVCGKESGGGYDFFCADCQTAVEIVSGREMQVEYVDLD
jgi:hydrogenase nickel incorporation protein HypA/HybF